MACGVPHPETGALCDMPEGQHAVHNAVIPGVPPRGVDWPNEEFSAPVKNRSKAQREQHKAMLRLAVVGAGEDRMAEATAHWLATKADWIAEAKRVLHTYCVEHDEPFTTPEDIWPLLDAPGEMRAFTVVVQHALKRRWIKEVSARRLRGAFTTRDGKIFEMNKISPIYQSRIVVAEDVRGSVLSSVQTPPMKG